MNTIIDKIEKQIQQEIELVKIKVNKFVQLYSENVTSCFYTHEENDELYQFLSDISLEFDIDEVGMYEIYLESKYNLCGELTETFDEDFATHITLQETIKK